MDTVRRADRSGNLGGSAHTGGAVHAARALGYRTSPPE